MTPKQIWRLGELNIAMAAVAAPCGQLIAAKYRGNVLRYRSRHDVFVAIFSKMTLLSSAQKRSRHAHRQQRNHAASK